MEAFRYAYQKARGWHTPVLTSTWIGLRYLLTGDTGYFKSHGAGAYHASIVAGSLPNSSGRRSADVWFNPVLEPVRGRDVQIFDGPCPRSMTTGWRLTGHAALGDGPPAPNMWSHSTSRALLTA